MTLREELVAAGVSLAGHQEAVSDAGWTGLASKRVKDSGNGRVGKGNAKGNYGDHRKKKDCPTHQAAHV